MSDLLYSTDFGKLYLGKCEDTIRELDLNGKVQLILTSPPFPLNNKKQYGNLNGDEYLKWFTDLAELFSSVLVPNGSIVIEMGNAWKKNRPVQSLLHLNSLLSFVNNEKAGLRLEMKNKLIQQGRYTDCVDELMFKVANAPVKRMKIESI